MPQWRGIQGNRCAQEQSKTEQTLLKATPIISRQNSYMYAILHGNNKKTHNRIAKHFSKRVKSMWR